LAEAGIAEVAPPDLGWLEADLAPFDLAGRFVLLVPGGAQHRPAKRWPAPHYASLGRRLAGQGVAALLLGAESEAALIAELAAAAPAARNLAGRTSLAAVAALARHAVAAVGNDTGPMHLIAGVGCPTVALFSADSDPALCAPRGDSVITLRRASLADLSVEEVAEALARAWRPAFS
jgi:ADP-heptose:LPS heptosyltransferase